MLIASSIHHVRVCALSVAAVVHSVAAVGLHLSVDVDGRFDVVGCGRCCGLVDRRGLRYLRLGVGRRTIFSVSHGDLCDGLVD
jgi:hypothetical protein